MESFSSKRAKAPAGNISNQLINCCVDGCNADLRLCKEYHRRHKVCEIHSKTAKVTISGREQRFCQQCSRFHSLVEFDEGKRSCRKRLDGHNRRRRKPQPQQYQTTSSLSLSSQQIGAGTLLSFSNTTNPQILQVSSSSSSCFNWGLIQHNHQYDQTFIHHHNHINTDHRHHHQQQPLDLDHQIINTTNSALSLLSPPLGLNHHQNRFVIPHHHQTTTTLVNYDDHQYHLAGQQAINKPPIVSAQDDPSSSSTTTSNTNNASHQTLEFMWE